MPTIAPGTVPMTPRTTAPRKLTDTRKVYESGVTDFARCDRDR
jgi:hypothetical protein